MECQDVKSPYFAAFGDFFPGILIYWIKEFIPKLKNIQLLQGKPGSWASCLPEAASPAGDISLVWAGTPGVPGR
ncbi:MAG: hypothetical protein DRI46_07515 [Chloroflexi bacterium]|nr:MAG: hypothetical protein DRI46_07515 [Chloroflexota bacterium]